MTPLILAVLFGPLVALANLRMTRFFTTDWLGEWLIVGPAKRWALKYESAAIDAEADRLELAHPSDILPPYDPQNPFSVQAKLVKVFDCPFCIGFWIGFLLLPVTALVIISDSSVAQTAWALFLAPWALNYIVGHISRKID